MNFIKSIITFLKGLFSRNKSLPPEPCSTKEVFDSFVQALSKEPQRLLMAIIPSELGFNKKFLSQKIGKAVNNFNNPVKTTTAALQGGSTMATIKFDDDASWLFSLLQVRVFRSGNEKDLTINIQLTGAHSRLMEVDYLVEPELGLQANLDNIITAVSSQVYKNTLETLVAIQGLL